MDDRERLAALFRHAPGETRLGDEPPGVIADAVIAGLLAAGWRAPARAAAAMSRPRDARDAEDWLYERAEEAAAVGLPLERALEMVRSGYSSVEADRVIAEDP